MPQMYEIYDLHAREYDELVDAEDYEQNLTRTLHDIVEWNDAVVVEAGTGTGRVTALYAAEAKRITCYDRSTHMLSAARRRLAEYAGKTAFVVGDNLALPDNGDTPTDADIFVEGWAFGHAVMDSGDPSRTCAQLIASARRQIRTGGTIIILETMGTAAEKPGAPHPLLGAFYRELEETHRFSPRVISTDYRFPSVEEAIRVMGFFFGEEMAAEVRRRGKPVIPEWTGLWYRRY